MKRPDDAPQPRSGEDRLLDHEVDGIREYDNPMPRWWLWIFYATIAFSVVYALNLPGLGPGKGRLADYEKEMAAARELENARKAAEPVLDDGGVLALAADPARCASGKVTFETTCSPCHRMDGGGSIGPNLTDGYWIHGGRPSEILKTVSDGVPDKGMPAWNAMLDPGQIATVVAYVTTLRGSNPPEPKAPQGVLVDSLGAR